MSAFKAALAMFDKLDDIIYRPIDAACNWLEEPLKRAKDRRDRERLSQEANIRDRDERRAAELYIQKATAIERARVELEQLEKDQNFARHKAMHEAIIGYQTELIALRENAFTSAGHLQIELAKKAEDFVHERRRRLKEFIRETREEQNEDIKQIQEQFGEDHALSERLIDQVIDDTVAIINAAKEFLVDLNQIGRRLQEGADRLSQSNMALLEQQAGHIKALQGHFVPGADPRLIDAETSQTSELLLTPPASDPQTHSDS